MNERDRARYEALARIFKAISHPTRLFIVEELSRNRRCVCELTEMIGVDTSTVSKHLSVMRNAGLLNDERVGNSIYYSLVAPCILSFFSCLQGIIKTSAEQQLELAEYCGSSISSSDGPLEADETVAR